MRRLLLLIAVGVFACDEAPEERPTTDESARILEPEGRQSKAPAVQPLPTDQKELDRLILAGYTPHGDHLHAPGVKNCPLAREGSEAVM